VAASTFFNVIIIHPHGGFEQRFGIRLLHRI
jgi:hypothetical protein